MGGSGSGRWGWHDKKQTVEDCLTLTALDQAAQVGATLIFVQAHCQVDSRCDRLVPSSLLTDRQREVQPSHAYPVERYATPIHLILDIRERCLNRHRPRSSPHSSTCSRGV